MINEVPDDLFAPEEEEEEDAEPVVQNRLLRLILKNKVRLR